MKQDAIAELLIKNIRTDGGTQMRAEIDEDTVDDYVAALDALPPVTVFYDGKAYWLADGFHRLRAHEKANKKVIYAEVKAGTQRDAILHAVGTNAMHGRRRTNADKRRAVEALLRDPEWSKWAAREIARRCAVDHKTVMAVKDSLSGEIPQTRTVKFERGGTVCEMELEKITKRDMAVLDERNKIKVRQEVERQATECEHEWVCSCAKCGEVKEE